MQRQISVKWLGDKHSLFLRPRAGFSILTPGLADRERKSLFQPILSVAEA